MIKIGMMIGGRYELLEKIGIGGMSEVYKVKDFKLNRFGAAKILKQEFSINGDFISKFRMEAQMAAGIMHPNIIDVYDAGEEDGIFYIVMELVEGITLKNYIERKGRLSLRETVSIAVQAAMGVGAAHNNQIIHRDIKPQNIIISIGGLVVQTVVNGFGMIFVAGFTATNKLYGILEVAATSFGFSMATYTGQNLGAGQYRRIKQGGKSAVIMAIGTALVISGAMVVFGKNILMLFISAEPEVAAQVLDVAFTYLMFMSSMLFVLYLLYVYRSGLQGMGDTIIPLVSGIAELVMRIGAALLLPRLIGQGGIYFAEILAWLAAELLLMGFFYYRLHKLLKRDVAGA